MKRSLHQIGFRTKAWRQGLRHGHVGRRWMMIAWIAMMLALAWWWAFSWMDIAQVKTWEGQIERFWNPEGGMPAWWQQGDLPFHVGTTLVMVLVLEFGRWLLQPGWPRWSVWLCAMVIALGDETLQACYAERTFDPLDLLNDAAGAGMAWLVVKMASSWIARRERNAE